MRLEFLCAVCGFPGWVGCTLVGVYSCVFCLWVGLCVCGVLELRVIWCCVDVLCVLCLAGFWGLLSLFGVVLCCVALRLFVGVVDLLFGLGLLRSLYLCYSRLCVLRLVCDCAIECVCKRCSG